MKKISSLVALSTFVLSVSACVSPTVNNNPSNVNEKIVNLSTVESKATVVNKEQTVRYVVDMAKVLKTNKPGASFNVNIESLRDAFNTKASTNGKNSNSIQSLRVNLCTDANAPFTSRLGANNGFKIARSGPLTANVVTFSNVPAGGPYFATVAAFDVPFGSIPDPAIAVEGLVAANNNGTAYSGDAGATIAVSTNSVTVNANLTLSPAAQVLLVPTNIQVIGANVDSTVTTADVNAQPLTAS